VKEFSYLRQDWRQKMNVGYSLVAEHLATEFRNSVEVNAGISDGYCDILYFGGEKLAGQGATE